jgi:RecA/RadA recombinase
MEFESGWEKHKERQKAPRVSTGDLVMDELLGGGVEPEVVYLFYGDKKVTGDLLYGIIVNMLERYTSQPEAKVVYADAYNRFNPYTLSKKVTANGMSPTECLIRS